MKTILFHIPPDSRVGKPPCGECHLKDGETCDICGAQQPTSLSLSAPQKTGLTDEAKE